MLLLVPTSANGQVVAILAPILVRVHQTKPLSNLGERFIKVIHTCMCI